MKDENSVHNQVGFYFFVGTIVFSGLWGLFFIFFYNSIDLGELADQKQEVAQSDSLTEEEAQKPWVSTESLVAHGSKIYKAQCALCHGAKGLGDGTPGLLPPPRNLVEGKWEKGGSSKQLYVTLEKGIPGTSMAPFKHLPSVDKWALVHYVRSITKNKIPDNLKELEEFAKNNL